jgi:hypothetical protein
VAQRRWGGLLGGLIAGLPLTSAPVSIFLALENGPRFAATSAVGLLLGVVAMSVFCAAYALSAKRLTWPFAAGLATAACIATMLAVARLPQNPVAAAAVSFPALVLLAWSIGLPASGGGTIDAPVWDTPVRMAVAVVAVVSITAAATVVGPKWSGLLATVPIFAAVMGVFSHRHSGQPAAQAVLRGVAVGALGAAAFFFVVATLLARQNLAETYVLACGLAIAVAGASHAAFSGRFWPRVTPSHR